MSDSHPHRHLALAALLSFIFPGLGQAYAGQRRLALVLAVPPLVLVAAGIVAAMLAGDELRNLLLSSAVLTGLLVLDVALMGWRLLAIAQVGFARGAEAVAAVTTSGGALALERGRRLMPASRAGRSGFVAALLIATIAMHAWAGVIIGRLDSTLGEIFSGGGFHGGQGPEPDGGAPLNQPDYSWDGTERINFLLLGVDAGPGREHALTDTILVVSVDPAARTAVMVSVPRDTGFMPLPDTRIYADGVYPKKINELSSEASGNPELWCPDIAADAAGSCGIRTLERTIGLYLGIPLQYYAQVDLEGFARLIDAVGGLTLSLPGPMIDPDYAGPGLEGRGIELPGGRTHYDGGEALAYARIRQGWIELPDGTREQQDDFKRSERQQRVLLELRRELAAADLLFELPAILDAIGDTVTTDFPRNQAGDLATLLPLISAPDIDRRVLGLPEYVDPPLEPLVNYLLIPRREAVAAEMERLFGAGVLDSWYLAGEEAPPASEPTSGG